MSFARPWLLWLAIALPALVALVFWAYHRRRSAVAGRLASSALLTRIGAGRLDRFPKARALTITAAAALLGVAAAGPQWGSVQAAGPARAANLVLALDVSKSMLAQDIEPNRLERQRIFARRLIRDLEGDRFGLVAFSGRGYVLSPLTSDRGALELFLDALEPEIVSQGGSSIASAIDQAAALAAGRDPGRGARGVILISDGEALEEREEVLDAAERAGRAGVAIFAVGVGTPAGATVPDLDPETGRMTGSIRGPDGEIVISRLDEDLLQRVADGTGGRYVRLGAPGATERLISGLRDLERTRTRDASGTRAGERYGWFLGLALLLLAVDAVALDRPNSSRKENA